MKRPTGRTDWQLIRYAPMRNKDLVVAEIARCQSVCGRRALAAGGLRGDWRRAAVAKRIKELEKAGA